MNTLVLPADLDGVDSDIIIEPDIINGATYGLTITAVTSETARTVVLDTAETRMLLAMMRTLT